MTSSLAKQLKAIQQEDRLVRGVPAGQTKRPSFLFGEEEAADYDNESIYVLGLEGFLELCKMDHTLRPFQARIFNSRLVGTDLSQMTKKERKEADDEVASFLVLLCPHFQAQAAHKVMEWLVRMWRVNEVNVDALMTCILPHHDTVAFVRMVQIIYFTSNSRWSFLFEKVKQGGSPVSRKLLAQRCTVDQAILGRIIRGFGDLRKHIKLYPEYKFSSLYVSFVTFLMLEIIAHTHKFSDAETIAFYQRLEMLIQGGDCPEALVGGMMVFMQLCERAPLSQAAILYVIRKIVQNCVAAIEEHVLLTVVCTTEAGYLNSLDSELAMAIAKLVLTHWNSAADLSSRRPGKLLELLLSAIDTGDVRAQLLALLTH